MDPDAPKGVFQLKPSASTLNPVHYPMRCGVIGTWRCGLAAVTTL